MDIEVKVARGYVKIYGLHTTLGEIYLGGVAYAYYLALDTLVWGQGRCKGHGTSATRVKVFHDVTVDFHELNGVTVELLIALAFKKTG